MKRQVKNEFGWDKGVVYEEVVKKIGANLIKYAVQAKATGNITDYRKFFYNAVLITQAPNASRISEALEAIFKYMDNPKQTIIKVYARKTKRKDSKNPGELRPMAIPKIVRRYQDVLEYCVFLKNSEFLQVRDAVRKYCEREYGFNTHSLRYACMTHLAEKLGLNPLIIQRITHHKNLNIIGKYIQNRVGIKVLKNLAESIDSIVER